MSRFDTTDAQIVRPYTGLHVLLYYNGRTTVRPYTGLHVLLYYNGRTTVRPYNRYSSVGSTTDTVTFDTTDALPLNTHRASLHQLLVIFAGSTMRGV